MQVGKIGIAALITLFTTGTTTFIPNCSASICVTAVFAQTPANRKAEAERLVERGTQQFNISQYQAALQSFQQALIIYREIRESSHGDKYPAGTLLTNALRQGEAKSLRGMGNVYYSLGQYQKAIQFHEQSLAIVRAIGDRIGEASSLNNLGNAYSALGQYQKAIKSYQPSLAMARENGDRVGEASYLNNLGEAYRNLGQYQRAIESYQQSLIIVREIGDRSGEAASLNNLGATYRSLGQYQQAIESYQQSLAIAREIGDRARESAALNNLGNAYSFLGEYQKAIAFYQPSLAMARAVGDRESEGRTLSNIGNLLAKQNQPELAIVFYKQSVNVREAIRQDIQGLPQEQQQSYIETIANTYRRLADLLLKQDRVLEAQRVLDLLKVQELEDYLLNVRGSDNTARGVAERSSERQFREGYEAILDQAIALGKELAQLETIPTAERTQLQQQRIVKLRKIEQEITKQFTEFLKSPEVAQLVVKLRQTTAGEGFDLDKYATSLQDNLKRLQQDAVILYPFILDDRLELVLVTPYAPPIRRTVFVQREELNRVIAEFRSALEKPTTDARTPAHQLYEWLIKPIERDLAQAKTKTIIYTPDGQLRYIPLAALYDGNQWLVQKFRINNITALSLTEFNTKPLGASRHTSLQVFAGAFTQGNYRFQIGTEQFTFSGLKYAGVEVENLAQIVPDTTKVLNKQFNQDTVFQMNDYSVVHLATHAAFFPGQPEESFILFGDGSRATLRDVENWRLSNVDLVVLSACETGLGDKLGDGKEVLGFGYQMQRTGARAAIASLWSVDDGGTQALMDAFYAALEQGNITKAEALRQAQIALIKSDSQPLSEQRGLRVEQWLSRSLPAAVKRRISHPYYWAPFILIGNGL